MFHENRRLGINPDTGVGWYPKFDEFAVRTFNLWAKYSKAKIVFSTHWAFSHTESQLKEIMLLNGLGFDYHEVLFTPKKPTSYRCNEIVWWLHDNAEAGDTFIAVDDDTSCQDIASMLGDEYNGHGADATGQWINVDYDNGMSWDNFLDGCDVLGIDIDEIYEKEFGIEPLTKKQKEYREGLLGGLI
jgi:hypothetical protein